MPKHLFELASNIEVDFSESGEAVLRNGNFDPHELRNFLHEKYGRTVSFVDRDKLIDELLDARYRAKDADYEKVSKK